MQQAVILLMMQKESNLKPNFDNLSKTINTLGIELGNVIKQQAGTKNFNLVEEIRINSKKYRTSKNYKYLDLIYKKLEKLNEIFQNKYLEKNLNTLLIKKILKTIRTIFCSPQFLLPTQRKVQDNQH